MKSRTMTAGQLIERLRQCDPTAEVQLIVWDVYDECLPGLHCITAGVSYGDGVLYLEGPGEREEMPDEVEDEE